MLESNQEGYRTLGWIINKSEQGMFLVIADEHIQSEIIRIYRQGAVSVYDYKRHPGAYSFHDLQQWVAGTPETRTFMIANFHLAVQNEESIKRLNFSRDMLEGLGKNFIFLVTPYWDDRLAVGAYDFYSFIKLRVLFHNYEMDSDEEGELLSLADEPVEESEWDSEESKQKLAETYDLLEQAREERDRAHYKESIELLLKAQKIKEKLLGPEHLEIAEIDNELAGVYWRQGKYEKAEELYEKSLRIRERVLGEKHPDTAASYNDLALTYGSQGKYEKAEELYEKSLRISERVLGEEHPDTATGYNNLAGVYESQGKYEKAEELYEKSLRIKEKVLGEEHPNTATGYNNLAYMYKSQGKNKMAISCYFKAYNILLFSLGIDHPRTQIVYENLKFLFEMSNPEGDFEQWIEENLKN